VAPLAVISIPLITFFDIQNFTSRKIVSKITR
jgi:hypothetical protein